MAMMDPLRGETVGVAQGEVLEIGFGTGRNLKFYDKGHVKAVHGLDPMVTEGVGRVDQRIDAAPFPVERFALEADNTLPFDAGRFDYVVTTWTLCSIPDAGAALSEMRRVLKPDGKYVFIEHGRSPKPGTARWQDRVNPWWNKLTDGCNLNRPIAEIVSDAGFEFESIREFKVTGPSLTSYMYSGVAKRS
jgi:ubiquinone/menaquinone biosynthesis C-methylase UbiE